MPRPRPFPRPVEGSELYVVLVHREGRILSPGAAPTRGGVYLVIYAWLTTLWRPLFEEEIPALTTAELSSPKRLEAGVRERLDRFLGIWTPPATVEVLPTRFFSVQGTAPLPGLPRRPQ